MCRELKFFLQVSEDDLDVSVKKTNIDFHTPGGSIDQILDLVVVLRFSLLLLSPGSLIAKLSNMWLIGENLFAIMKLSIRFFCPGMPIGMNNHCWRCGFGSFLLD